MTLPDVSLVIPARNAERWFAECLEGVRALDYPSDKLEVLLVDNNSTDATARLARQAGHEPLPCARPGAAAARNLAIERARGRIVAFLDSDAVPRADWLTHLVEPFADVSVGGVGGKVEPYRTQTGSEFHAACTRILDQEKHLAGRPPFMLPFVATANAAYRADALRQVGGFDEQLSICEDADLAWRVAWAGHRLAYAPNAVVRHHNRPERGPYLRQVYDYGQGTVRLFAKHRSRLGRRVWIEWRHFGALASAVVRIPVAPFLARERWQRVMPVYDLAAGACWTAGRIAGSIRHRVLAI